MDIYKTEHLPSEHKAEMLKRSVLGIIKPKMRHPRSMPKQMEVSKQTKKTSPDKNYGKRVQDQ